MCYFSHYTPLFYHCGLESYVYLGQTSQEANSLVHPNTHLLTHPLYNLAQLEVSGDGRPGWNKRGLPEGLSCCSCAFGRAFVGVLLGVRGSRVRFCAPLGFARCILGWFSSLASQHTRLGRAALVTSCRCLCKMLRMPWEVSAGCSEMAVTPANMSFVSKIHFN